MGLIQKLEAAATERSLGKSTVACYSFWARKFYGFCQKPASAWIGEDVRSWLLLLADENYSAVSRKQALNSIVFVFKYVLKKDLGQLDLPPMPKVRQTLRVIPSREELGRIFAGLHGQVKLMAGLMYGSGLRVLCECCRLRVQDIDLEALTVRVQDGNDIKTVQDLLGHESLETTMIYLHGDAARGVSPLDAAPRVVSPLAMIGGF